VNQAKLSAKNQIVVPEMVREKLELTPGDVLDFMENELGEIVLKKGNRQESFFSLLDQVHDEAEKEGVTEEELLAELAHVRKARRHGDK
jgi:AbrB family looped-hinge helix DNA binding protein